MKEIMIMNGNVNKNLRWLLIFLLFILSCNKKEEPSEGSVTAHYGPFGYETISDGGTKNFELILYWSEPPANSKVKFVRVKITGKIYKSAGTFWLKSAEGTRVFLERYNKSNVDINIVKSFEDDFDGEFPGTKWWVVAEDDIDGEETLFGNLEIDLYIEWKL